MNAAGSDEPAIAVLMTCHNRRDKTLACLAALAGQPLFDAENLFLVDDGSSDGTGASVRALLPGANMIDGDGTLFWAGGMRLAWSRAKASGRGFTYYLWLNDDVVLDPGALAMLVEDTAAAGPAGSAAIVAGATRDPASGTITYGAHRRPDRRRPLRLQLVAPAGRPLPVDTISGNVVLVSSAAEARLGSLAGEFEHSFADLDYGLRAKAAGIPVLLARRVAGICPGNPMTGTSLDPNLGRVPRLSAALRELRRVHARDWRRLVRRHGGGRLAVVAHTLAPLLRIVLNRPHRHAAIPADPSPGLGS
ncbi:MAG: glycosyltransferase [Novosphingobium sp.]